MINYKFITTVSKCKVFFSCHLIECSFRYSVLILHIRLCSHCSFLIDKALLFTRSPQPKRPPSSEAAPHHRQHHRRRCCCCCSLFFNRPSPVRRMSDFSSLFPTLHNPLSIIPFTPWPPTHPVNSLSAFLLTFNSSHSSFNRRSSLQQPQICSTSK